ncbi:MAG: hypothetical protein ACKOI2_12350 [Actinomycetota bacterium]
MAASARRSRRPLNLFLVFASVGLFACSSETESNSESLAIDAIDEAISAVAEHFDADVDFYEINATSDGVNLFVSTTAADETSAVVQARFTRAGDLVVAEESVPAEGPVFRGSAVDFDSASILETAISELSTAQPRMFIITAVSDGANSTPSDQVSYRLIMESQRGGRLVVFLDSRGTVLGSDVID